MHEWHRHRRPASPPLPMRHAGWGGRAGRVELLTGIEGASSRPVRKIVVLEAEDGPAPEGRSYQRRSCNVSSTRSAMR